jgi:hypothetical protein
MQLHVYYALPLTFFFEYTPPHLNPSHLNPPPPPQNFPAQARETVPLRKKYRGTASMIPFARWPHPHRQTNLSIQVALASLHRSPEARLWVFVVNVDRSMKTEKTKENKAVDRPSFDCIDQRNGREQKVKQPNQKQYAGEPRFVYPSIGPWVKMVTKWTWHHRKCIIVVGLRLRKSR